MFIAVMTDGRIQQVLLLSCDLYFSSDLGKTQAHRNVHRTHCDGNALSRMHQGTVQLSM